MASQSITRCAVCHGPCSLQSCVTDEQGRAVHASCYTKSISSHVRVSGTDEVEDLLQQARELREVADELIRKSDRLIEAYKQLTGQAKAHRLDGN